MPTSRNAGPLARRGFFRGSLFALVVAWAFANGGTAAQDNPLDPPKKISTRYFEGDGLIVSLQRLDGTSGRVQGQIRLGDRVFPYTGATSGESSFAGEFQAGDNKFSFTASRSEGERWTFVTGSSSYSIESVDRPSRPFPGSPEPENPLASGDSKADAFTGTWKGTGKDEADDGTPLTFPVTIDFVSSPQGELTAELRSTVDYPVGSGQTIPVEITGRFTGRTASGKKVELSAREVLATTQGQSESLGAQTLRLELSSDGRMTGTVGNPVEGWTPLQLRREKGPAAPDRQRPSNDRSDGGDKARRQNAAALPPRMVFEKVTLRDPGVNGMESHTLLKPKGWEVEGGPQWNARAFRDFVHMNLRVRSGDGRELAVYPGGFYEDSDVYEIGARMGATGGRPKPGTVTTDGIVHMPLPESASDYVTQIVLPAHRPQARSVRVIDRTPLPEVEQRMRTLMEPALENAHRNDAQLRQMGAHARTTMSIVAERVRVAYEESGGKFEEDLWVLGTVQRNAQQMPNMPMVNTVHWIMTDPRGVRAPAGQLDSARPILEAISFSLQPNPRYSAVLMQLRNKINQQQLDALVKIGEINRRGQQEAWEIYQSGVKEQQASSERLQESFNDYIRDVDDFQDVDGSSVKLPGLYSYVYSNGQGEYVLTNEPTFDPNDGATERWQRIDPDR